MSESSSPAASAAATPGIPVEISPGELIDKITILAIKAERIDDPEKARNVRYELDLLNGIRARHIAADGELARLEAELKEINEALWEIEDDIRDCERNGDFGDAFVGLARAVYKTNDRRAAVKRAINVHCGSAIVEEKSYSDY